MTDQKESDLQPPYYVLYCPYDDSHALVGETSLLYDDEDLSLEEKVNFIFPGHKSPLEGIIKGKSENYNEMMTLQDKLNRASKPKRQQSFSPSRPRKAAVKCMEGLNIKHQPRSSAKAGKSSKMVQQPEMPMDRSISPKGPNIYSDSDSSKSDNGILKSEIHNEVCVTDENDSLSSDSSVLSPEEQALALKLERKKAAKELKALRALSSPGNHDHEKKNNEEKGDKKTESQKNNGEKGDKKTESKKNNEEKGDKKTEYKKSNKEKGDKKTEYMKKVDIEKKDKKNESERNVDSEKLNNDDKKNESETEVDSEKKNDKKTNAEKTYEESSSDDMKMKAPPAKKRKIQKKVPTNHLEYKGTHFRWQSADPKVELLHSSYDVYVKSKDLKRLKSKAVTGTALARGALRLVFTDDALANCSVSGKPAPGKNGVRETRTALDKEGIEAILDFVKARLTKNKLHCSESSLKLLCEKRAEVPTEDLPDKGNKADQDSHDN